jgi:predicted AAA+ superfamily ATPase
LFQDYLKTTGVNSSHIIAVNLEDEIQTREIGLKFNNKSKLLENYGTLLDFIANKLAKDEKTYIFLDEIQLLESWQRLANALRLQNNADVYLTGSNAYMFSSDLANVFGGRYVEIKMQPLSFKEYVGNADNLQDKYEQYTRESGFPQTVFFNHERQMINSYLQDSVYKNTVQKDIIQRLKLTDAARLDEVIKFLFDNIGNETSLLSVQRKLKSSGIDISPTTLNSYVKGLLDSYLMYKCERYDIRGKRILESDAKYYAADIGLRTALLGRQDLDLGRSLENVVYLELLRRGYQVFVGKVKRDKAIKEVDFVALQAGGAVEYYQVAWSVLGDLNTLRRELSSLEEIKDNYPKFLLTMDWGNGENNGIKRLNALEWLAG